MSVRFIIDRRTPHSRSPAEISRADATTGSRNWPILKGGFVPLGNNLIGPLDQKVKGRQIQQDGD